MKREIPSILAVLLLIAILIGVTASSASYVLSGTPVALPENSGVVGAASGMFATLGMKNAAPPESVAVDYMRSLDVGVTGERYAVSTDGQQLCIDRAPSGTTEGRQLYDLLQGKWSFTIDEAVISGTSASVNVYITCLDTALFSAPLRNEVTDFLNRKVEAASYSSEVYDENRLVLQSVKDEAYRTAWNVLSANAQQYYSLKLSAVLKLEFYQREWHIINMAAVTDTLDARAAEIVSAATDDLPYIPKLYTIDETATEGPVPEQTNFGSTDDPAEVSALLQTRAAQDLIGGQQLCFNPNLDFVAGTPIRYYLDDTLLMVEWQEEECGMVGTFSEVFVADGSQIRRKFAGDSYDYQYFYYATELAQQTNSVLAVGGDLFHHGRNCGIVVYNRTVYRFEPATCDICYITTDGDMLFSYRNQFQTIEEAQKFVDDNDILYSIAFGPVMIDNGVDVTPDNYAWGEINDTYARAALGMLGEHHYLTMNLNCGTGHLYNYATLRQAADVMVQRNCIKAYTLDGGQTCCTIVNGELVSPVQFGYERYTSDIIYFATAIPASESN